MNTSQIKDFIAKLIADMFPKRRILDEFSKDEDGNLLWNGQKIAMVKTWTVNFYNSMNVMEHSVQVEDRQNAVYSWTEPVKNETNFTRYTFAGWNNEPSQNTAWEDALLKVDEDRNLYPAFSIEHKVYFKNTDDTLIELQYVPTGGNCTDLQNLPTKESDDDGTVYEFSGWNIHKDATSATPNATKNITASKTFYPVFTAVIDLDEEPDDEF